MPADIAADGVIRVAHVTTVDMSLRYLLLNQLLDLKQHGYAVTGVSASGPDVVAIEQAGIRHIAVGLTRRMAPLADVRAFFDLVRVFRHERFDIVHTHNPKPGLFGQIAARLAGVPLVVNTIHGLYFHQSARGVRRSMATAAERVAARCSDRILSQSAEDVATIVRERIAPPGKVRHLGNGIDLRRFNADVVDDAAVARLRVEFGFEPHHRIIGFVGRLVAEKGLTELITATRTVLEQVRNARLLIVGPSDAHKPDAVTPHLAASLGVADACRFVGLQSDMPTIYALMDVFVLPSHREGVPRSPMEAAAMGVPAIVTDVRGCREVVVDGENGLIVPVNDPEALARAIVSVLADEKLARRLSANGRRLAAERFDEQRIFTIVRDEYETLLRRRAQEKDTRAAGWYRSGGKRALDVAGAALALVLLLPLIAIVAVAVYIFLGRPILFRQIRPGLHERPFEILKFRTMTNARTDDGMVRTDAERLTALGRWLRALSLDELPELVNVLRGDMSLVGPRPLLMHYLERYSPEQRRRHAVRPGLTGWAQVNGRNAVSWPEKLRCDVWYVDHLSWWLDLKILALTVPALVTRHGVTQPGRATTDEFMGER